MAADDPLFYPYSISAGVDKNDTRVTETIDGVTYFEPLPGGEVTSKAMASVAPACEDERDVDRTQDNHKSLP